MSGLPQSGPSPDRTRRRVDLIRPSGVPACRAGLGLLALSGLLATLAAWGWSPNPNAGTALPVLLAAGALAGGTAAMLYGAELLRGGGGDVLHPARSLESVGPCQLIQLGPDRWVLRLDSPTAGALRFAIDEAHAAEMSRVFDSEEVLRLCWVDLPPALGGRALLRIEALEARPHDTADLPVASNPTEVRHAA